MRDIRRARVEEARSKAEARWKSENGGDPLDGLDDENTGDGQNVCDSWRGWRVRP
jgi:hypothetical protein